MTFASIHNRHEKDVYAKVEAATTRYPFLLKNPDLMADAACVALNAIQPHYIRHDLDMSFYMSDAERVQDDLTVSNAVESAVQYIQSRETTRRR